MLHEIFHAPVNFFANSSQGIFCFVLRFHLSHSGHSNRIFPFEGASVNRHRFPFESASVNRLRHVLPHSIPLLFESLLKSKEYYDVILAFKTMEDHGIPDLPVLRIVMKSLSFIRNCTSFFPFFQSL